MKVGVDDDVGVAVIEGLPDGAGVGVPASPSSGTFCVSVDALSAINGFAAPGSRQEGNFQGALRCRRQ